MLGLSFLGVDIGSVSVSAALVDSSGEIAGITYRAHRGRVKETLAELVAGFGCVPLASVACTPEGAPFFRQARTFDSQVSLIAACRRLYPGARSILFVGGERFGLIRLDGQGGYRGARTNSSCASGTGSFLDQQARRLGFPDVQGLVESALASTTPPPKISTRCAVFARTDLVHAQQAGYSLPEICDGLCRGLAQNICDTLLGGERPEAPVVFAGGVALNAAVRAHLEQILGVPLPVDGNAPVLGALGAALSLAADNRYDIPNPLSAEDILAPHQGKKEYFFAPLEIEEPDGAAVNAEMRWQFTTGRHAARHPVEVDHYAGPLRISGSGARGALAVRIGIDIGSTSTKAILVGGDRAPVAGFYTRTLGSPLTAVQAVAEAVEDWVARTGTPLEILGAATTGAGRKFIGAIVKADLVVDEITAHARAAYELDPRIDTIIEIGGQDAKFTTIRDGMVTFSHMNTVCAAGTGSFLEEQAMRLGCSLADYEGKVRGVRAPLSSDRCAVFMERDINNFLAGGFSTEEILAAALYSVRENYLSKVAHGAAIGERIAFQGATARNRALVAAFRAGLGRPIMVSRYCHLTGALGAALLQAESAAAGAAAGPSRFIGLAGLRADIPVRSETCTLCSNHCRLRIATVGGETVAYGFLCGRDYEVERFVDRDRSGFSLLKERKKAFDAAMPAAASVEKGVPVIGIPAALGVYGQLPLWKSFFALLGVRTVTSERFTAGIDAGREVQGAEFCAPLAALHGHVRHLRDQADWLFLPVFIDETGEHRDPQVYCYYTQFSTALVSGAGDPGLRARCLVPSVSLTKGRERTKRELFDELRRAGITRLGREEVDAAFERASAAFARGVQALQGRFREEMARATGPSVVLLGRPYNVLSPEMSKGIAEIFGALGVKTFSQDMVPRDGPAIDGITPLLEQVHWLHATSILEAAAVVAETPGLYPVYVTSFKCSPDSFALEYFRRLFDGKGKPYLVLQLDDHDSTLGYETRIEAGVASFRNHARRAAAATGPSRQAGGPRSTGPVNPRPLSKLEGRTLLFPAWDPLANPLLAANFRRQGIDARLLEEDPFVIRKAMRQNTGQCLPLNILVEESVDYVRRHGLDPARTALWMPRSNWSCNFGMFTPFLKTLMEGEGGEGGTIEVYAGDSLYLDLPLAATLHAYQAYLAGGLLRRVGCRLRPYEAVAGATDRATARALEILLPAFEGKTGLPAALRAAAGQFDDVRVAAGPRRPRVAVFGDFYVRDNDVMNQGLIRAIEGAGGEAITTPYTDYVRIIAAPYFRKWQRAGLWGHALSFRALWLFVDLFGRGVRRPFARFLDPEPRFDNRDSERFVAAFGLRDENEGESFDNLLKIHHLARAHPALALFVQASPAFCCPSLVTEGMGRDIERLTGVPVVSVTYDGTGAYMNDVIVPYVKYPRRRAPA
jgi:predicted CoA-substrate-specific enzyme activase